MTVHRVTRKFATAEAVADALDFLSPRIRDGSIMGLSIEWHPTGSARVSFGVAPGLDVPELELAGVAEEEDEHSDP